MSSCFGSVSNMGENGNATSSPLQCQTSIPVDVTTTTTHLSNRQHDDIVPKQQKYQQQFEPHTTLGTSLQNQINNSTQHQSFHHFQQSNPVCLPLNNRYISSASSLSPSHDQSRSLHQNFSPLSSSTMSSDYTDKPHNNTECNFNANINLTQQQQLSNHEYNNRIQPSHIHITTPLTTSTSTPISPRLTLPHSLPFHHNLSSNSQVAHNNAPQKQQDHHQQQQQHLTSHNSTNPMGSIVPCNQMENPCTIGNINNSSTGSSIGSVTSPVNHPKQLHTNRFSSLYVNSSSKPHHYHIGSNNNNNNDDTDSNGTHGLLMGQAVKTIKSTPVSTGAIAFSNNPTTPTTTTLQLPDTTDTLNRPFEDKNCPHNAELWYQDAQRIGQKYDGSDPHQRLHPIHAGLRVDINYQTPQQQYVNTPLPQHHETNDTAPGSNHSHTCTINHCKIPHHHHHYRPNTPNPQGIHFPRPTTANSFDSTKSNASVGSSGKRHRHNNWDGNHRNVNKHNHHTTTQTDPKLDTFSFNANQESMSGCARPKTSTRRLGGNCDVVIKPTDEASRFDKKQRFYDSIYDDIDTDLFPNNTSSQLQPPPPTTGTTTMCSPHQTKKTLIESAVDDDMNIDANIVSFDTLPDTTAFNPKLFLHCQNNQDDDPNVINLYNITDLVQLDPISPNINNNTSSINCRYEFDHINILTSIQDTSPKSSDYIGEFHHEQRSSSAETISPIDNCNASTIKDCSQFNTPIFTPTNQHGCPVPPPTTKCFPNSPQQTNLRHSAVSTHSSRQSSVYNNDNGRNYDRHGSLLFCDPANSAAATTNILNDVVSAQYSSSHITGGFTHSLYSTQQHHHQQPQQQHSHHHHHQSNRNVNYQKNSHHHPHVGGNNTNTPSTIHSPRGSVHDTDSDGFDLLYKSHSMMGIVNIHDDQHAHNMSPTSGGGGVIAGGGGDDDADIQSLTRVQSVSDLVVVRPTHKIENHGNSNYSKSHFSQQSKNKNNNHKNNHIVNIQAHHHPTSLTNNIISTTSNGSSIDHATVHLAHLEYGDIHTNRESVALSLSDIFSTRSKSQCLINMDKNHNQSTTHSTTVHVSSPISSYHAPHSLYRCNSNSSTNSYVLVNLTGDAVSTHSAIQSKQHQSNHLTSPRQNTMPVTTVTTSTSRHTSPNPLHAQKLNPQLPQQTQQLQLFDVHHMSNPKLSPPQHQSQHNQVQPIHKPVKFTPITAPTKKILPPRRFNAKQNLLSEHKFHTGMNLCQTHHQRNLFQPPNGAVKRVAEFRDYADDDNDDESDSSDHSFVPIGPVEVDPVVSFDIPNTTHFFSHAITNNKATMSPFKRFSKLSLHNGPPVPSNDVVTSDDENFHFQAMVPNNTNHHVFNFGVDGNDKTNNHPNNNNLPHLPRQYSHTSCNNNARHYHYDPAHPQPTHHLNKNPSSRARESCNNNSYQNNGSNQQNNFFRSSNHIISPTPSSSSATTTTSDCAISQNDCTNNSSTVFNQSPLN